MASAVVVVKEAPKTLTIDQKPELLEQIGKKSCTVLCEEYRIGRSTISDIRKQESSFKQYKRKMKDMGVKQPAKVMRLGKDEELKTALYLGSSRNERRGFQSQEQYFRLGSASCTNG